MNRSPAFGKGNTGSVSENATSAGLSQRPSASLRGEHLRHAGLVLGQRDEQREALRSRLALRVRETAPRRRRRRPRGRSVVVAPWMIMPIGRSGVRSANSRQAMKPLLTRPVNSPVFRITRRADLVGVLDRPAQPDRPAPVLHHNGHVVELDLIEVRGHRLDVAVVRVPALVGRLVRAPEPDQVGADDAVPARPQAGRACAGRGSSSWARRGSTGPSAPLPSSRWCRRRPSTST